MFDFLLGFRLFGGGRAAGGYAFVVRCSTWRTDNDTVSFYALATPKSIFFAIG